jgi:SAM-dependent methyltransferase
MALFMAALYSDPSMTPSHRFTAAEEEAGAREPFDDPALYDFEYRRRRADVNFYRRIAEERGESRNRRTGVRPDAMRILDLACGTGRLLVPLVRDGHTVVGLDRSRPMLARGAARLRRLSKSRRNQALLFQSDLRRFAVRRPFALAICAFHSIQHLVADDDLLRCFRAVKQCLEPGGWFAFDLLPPDPVWLGRDPERRWARTRFVHPGTGERLIYTQSQRYDSGRKALHMRMYYQPVDPRGRPIGEERVMRLCHRQLTPLEVKELLARAGFDIIASFGGFDGRPLDGRPDGDDDQHIYVARPVPTKPRKSSAKAQKSDKKLEKSRKKLEENPGKFA